MQKGKALLYSVQKHYASHLHYDLRLEKDGVLKSWAVPKGISTDSSKRLAVETEDHPLSYVHFEGIIPEGQYGAGKVELWDKGTYEIIKWGDREIEVNIHGEKIRGHYVLLKIKEKNWIIFKKVNKM